MADKEYNIQELVHRDVYVNDKKVGTIVGERHHPNEARVQSMRIQVETDVADEDIECGTTDSEAIQRSERRRKNGNKKSSKGEEAVEHICRRQNRPSTNTLTNLKQVKPNRCK